MPTVVLANNIGQATSEVQAQTQKTRVAPVTVNADGTLTNPNIKAAEIPAGTQPPALPETLAEAVSATEPVIPTPVTPKKDPAKLQEEERFAAIVRREKAMRQRVREYETQQAALKAEYEAKEQAYKAQVEEASTAKQWQERLKTDLIGTLTEAGYSTDQITQALINQPGPESQLIKSLSDKIAKMEKAQQDNFKAQQEEANKNYQNALKTIERNVNDIVNKNPEFEMTKASESQKKVVSYIEKVWKEEGVMLDVEDAAKDVEDYLTEEAIKLARLGKIQRKLAPQKPKTPAPAPAQAAAPKPAQTLTNRMSAGGKPLTSRERAIAAFNANRVKR